MFVTVTQQGHIKLVTVVTAVVKEVSLIVVLFLLLLLLLLLSLLYILLTTAETPLTTSVAVIFSPFCWLLPLHHY